MRRLLQKLTTITAAIAMCSSLVQAQNSFSYQAVVRDNNGNLLADQKVGVRISLIDNNTTCYQESHIAKSNKYGNISLMVGEGAILSGKFDEVPWSTMKIMMKVELDVAGGTNYTELGTMQIQPVPYSMYAAKAAYAESAPATKEIVASADASDSEPLFSVKDKDGNIVFAVYPNSVYVYVNDDNSKAQRSGFYVRGATKAKDDDVTEYFTIDNTGTQVFVNTDETSKAQRSGFYVRGATKAKDDTTNYFAIDDAGTQVFVDTDNSSKAQRSGFYVRGATKAKDDTTNYFAIDNTGTQVYVNSGDEKAQRSAFYVRGATKAKDDFDDYVKITTDSTTFYIGDDAGKAQKSAFYISGRSKAKDGSNDYLTISGDSTRFYVNDDAGSGTNGGFAITSKSGDKSYFAVKQDSVNVNATLSVDGDVTTTGEYRSGND